LMFHLTPVALLCILLVCGLLAAPLSSSAAAAVSYASPVFSLLLLFSLHDAHELVPTAAVLAGAAVHLHVSRSIHKLSSADLSLFSSSVLPWPAHVGICMHA
jgi:hypothetical protein